MKHTETTLSKHPKVRNQKLQYVYVVTGKRVRLDRNYDPDLLDRHVKNKICTSDDGNSHIISTQNSKTSKKKENFIGKI